MTKDNQVKNAKRIGALAVLICLMLWGWSQQRTSPHFLPDTTVLLQQAQEAFDAGEYQISATLCDTALNYINDVTQRAKWYDGVWLHTMAHVRTNSATVPLLYLTNALQKQTIDDSITAKVYGLAGFACLHLRNFDLANWYYEKNLAGLLRHHCKNGIGTAYMNLGYALKEQGDFRNARQYFLTALPLLHKEGYPGNIYEALNNLGDISRFLFEFDTARDYYWQMMQVYPTQKAGLASALGWTNANQGRYQEALTHFREACPKNSCANELARIMGHCSEMLGDTLEAKRQYQLAIKSAPTARDSSIAQSYLGHSLLQRKQPATALPIFQQALAGLFPQFHPKNLEENPHIGPNAEFWTVELLRGKAQAFRALSAQTGKVPYLRNALSTISAAVTALDSLRAGMRNETSGQDAVDYAYSTYETGIQIALDLQRAEPEGGHLQKAYQMAEQAKSNVLKANLAEKDLRRSAQIPDSLLWQEKTALAAVAYWEETGRPDSLLAATRHLETVRAAIDRQVPVLRKARVQGQNPSMATIQADLGASDLLLQYFWGDSAVVVFAVGKRDIHTHHIPRSAALDRSIDTLRAALTQWRLSPEAYTARAAPVFQQFCAPLLAKAGKIERLFIVPDGPLWAVPFEALPTTTAGRFLLEDHAVSYHWSGALWLQARKQGQQAAASTEYGGFAPQYPAGATPMATLGAGLGDLPEARAAVASAATAWGGTVWQGPTVDEALFRREAGRYGVLHLAMHGLLDLRDRTRTGLAFPAADDSIHLLNTLEISQLDLKAQLAVLSACNTGSGVVYRGEGVMSLSRAFALAGCPALTANLWAVPSRETNDITAAFLDLLKGGNSKDEALRSAKLDFLNRAESERRHPYFWAGQVLIGNEGPLRGGRGWVFWCLGVLVFLGGAAVMYRYFTKTPYRTPIF